MSGKNGIEINTIDDLVKNTDSGYVPLNENSPWTMENCVKDFLKKEYNAKGMEAAHATIGGKDVVIPAFYVEQFPDCYKEKFVEEFYCHQRNDVQKALAAYNNGEDSGEIGFIKIGNDYAPILPNMDIKAGTENEVRAQVFHHFFDKNYIHMHYGKFLDSYYNLQSETLEDRIAALVDKGLEKFSPYARKIANEYNALGMKVAKDLWNAEWKDGEAQKLAAKVVKETFSECRKLIKQIWTGQKELDPDTLEKIHANIAYLREFGSFMLETAKKAPEAYKRAAVYFNETSEKVAGHIKGMNISIETKAKVLGYSYLSSMVLSGAAQTIKSFGGKDSGSNFAFPSGVVDNRDPEKASISTYDATKNFMDYIDEIVSKSRKQAEEAAGMAEEARLAKEENERQAAWAKDQAEKKALWEAQEKKRIAKEAKDAELAAAEEAKRIEETKKAEVTRPLAASKQTGIKVEAKKPAGGPADKIKQDPKKIPLTKEQKKTVDKAKKAQVKKEIQEQKKIAENEKKLAKENEKIIAEKIELNKKSIRAESEANRKGDFALAKQIRDVRENKNIVIMPNHLRADLKPIYGENPTPRDSLLKMIPYSHRTDLSEKKLENRESCYEIAINVIGRKKGYNYPYFNELVRATVAMAANESGFKSDVKAGTSSATGLFQPLNTTFLQAVYHDMDNYSLLMGISKAELEKKLVEKVNKAKNKKGQSYAKSVSYVIEDKDFRTKVLNKRKDKNVGIYFGVNHMLEHLESSEKQLGRTLHPSEYGRFLYGKHHLGEEGCKRYLAKADKPVAKNDKVAKANSWMFNCKDYGAVIDKIADMYNKQYEIETKSWNLHKITLAKINKAAEQTKADAFQYENFAGMLKAEEQNTAANGKGSAYVSNPNFSIAAWQSGQGM